MNNATQDTAEKTVIVTVNLPPGQNWVWFADCNMVGLAPHLDADGRWQALTEAHGHRPIVI